MSDKNIIVKKRNESNTGWDNLYPITLANNVKMPDGKGVEEHLMNVNESLWIKLGEFENFANYVADIDIETSTDFGEFRIVADILPYSPSFTALPCIAFDNYISTTSYQFGYVDTRREEVQEISIDSNKGAPLGGLYSSSDKLTNMRLECFIQRCKLGASVRSTLAATTEYSAKHILPCWGMWSGNSNFSKIKFGLKSSYFKAGTKISLWGRK